MHTKSVSIAAGAGSLLLLPALAAAQTAAPSMDLAQTMLHQVFGDPAGGAPNTLLGGAMQVVNGFALSFGVVMFIWLTVIGTIRTAQEGTFLGQMRGKFFLPLRTTAAIALLFPAYSGFSAAQLGVLWLAVQGSTAANMVLAQGVASLLDPAKQGAAVADNSLYDASVRETVRGILQAETCLAAVADKYGFDSGARWGVAYRADERTGATRITWGDRAERVKRLDVCGSLETGTIARKGLERPLAAVGGLGVAGAVGFSVNRDFERITTAITAGQAQAIGAAMQAVRPVAQQLGKATRYEFDSNGAPVRAIAPAEITDEQLQAAMAAGVAGYKASMQSSLGQLAAATTAHLSKFADNAKDAGWVMTGSMFFQMTKIRSELNRLASWSPTVNEGDLKEQVVGNPYAAVKARLGALADPGEANEVSFLTDPAGWVRNKINSFMHGAVKLVGTELAYDPNDHRHALVQIKDAGDKLLLASEAFSVVSYGGYAAVVLGAAVGGGTGQGIVGNLMAPLLPLAYLMIGTMFGLALTMSFLLPLLPFITFLGGVVGWLMAVFQAVVAAPVWIAGHLHPDGNELTGAGTGGYMLVLETAMRPVLLVMALFGVFLALDPVLKLLAVTYFAAIGGMQGSSTTGPVSLIVFIAIYVTLCFTVIRTVTSMVYALPEAVWRWVGGQFAGMEQGRVFEGDARGHLQAHADRGRHVTREIDGAQVKALQRLHERRRARAAAGQDGTTPG